MKFKKPRFLNPALWPAMLSALVAPGVGQIVNRDYAKGALLLAASLGSFLWFSKVITEQISILLPGTPDQWIKDQPTLRAAILKLGEQNASMFLTFQLLILVVWTFGVIDAYISAKKKIQQPLTQENNEEL